MSALTEATFEQTCDHESGHAAMALVLDVPVRLVEVKGDATALGRTYHEGLTQSDAGLRTRMKIILGGLIASADRLSDLPAWPLDPDRGTTDERNLAQLAGTLDLDRAGYRAIVDHALALSDTPGYKRLRIAISHLLAIRGELGRDALEQLKTIVTEGANVEHKTLTADTLEAVDSSTDLGQFTALVSAWGADREGDTIAPDAFDKTIRAWQASGKNLPLLFEHSTEEIGAVDPNTMRATEDGLIVSGEVDRSTEHGAQAWRQVKRGTASYSIGFMAESTPRPEGKGRHITEVDLLEISHTSTPMHPAARALAWKSAGEDPEPWHDPAFDSVRLEWSGLVKSWLGSTSTKRVESQREMAERITREFAPIEIPTFDVA